MSFNQDQTREEEQCDCETDQRHNVMAEGPDPAFQSFVNADDAGCEAGSHGQENQNRNPFIDHLTLPLRTPDRRLLSSDNTSLVVRKRSSSPSPTHDCDSVDAKQRQVSKALFTATSEQEEEPLRIGASRCLFGPPLQDANCAVRKNIQDKMKLDYVNFCQRYEVISKVKDF